MSFILHTWNKDSKSILTTTCINNWIFKTIIYTRKRRQLEKRMFLYGIFFISNSLKSLSLLFAKILIKKSYISRPTYLLYSKPTNRENITSQILKSSSTKSKNVFTSPSSPVELTNPKPIKWQQPNRHTQNLIVRVFFNINIPSAQLW